jgi:hypothetical protein
MVKPVENLEKPHYFELVMNSYSEGVLNQEVAFVREYAATGPQLTAKQMAFTKIVAAPIVATVVDAMDQMSLPFQELGMKEMLEEFANGG